MNRGESQQPYSSPGEALEHHGVKGMKWGVRKEEDGAGSNFGRTIPPTNPTEHNAQNKAYLSAAAAIQAKPVSVAQQIANLKTNRELFVKKFESSEAEGFSQAPAKSASPGAVAKAREKWHNLDPETKQNLIIVGVTGAAVAGIIGYGLYANHYALPTTAMFDNSGLGNAKPGGKIGLGAFIHHIDQSQMATMSTENFFRPESFARPAFELPAGHNFMRISAAAEKTFGQATYCSASPDDYNRYACALGVQGIKRHLVEFQATKAIKVPALSDVLHTVREQMGRDYGISDLSKISDADVLDRYKSISHQQWRGQESLNLIRSLKAKGYGAIVDEMDAGVFSERPLVLFSSNVTPKRGRVLTRKDLTKSLRDLKEIGKPPGRALPTTAQLNANKSVWEQVVGQIHAEAQSAGALA